MEIHIHEENRIVVVQVTGRMGELSAPEFEQQMMNLVIEAGNRVFIVDFEQLDYISSAGLKSLLSVAKKLDETDGRLYLVNLKGEVREVFEISRLISIFTVFETVKEALHAAQSERTKMNQG